MIQRLTLDRSEVRAGHWAPGPPPIRERPSTPRQVRAERELADWLGRRAVFGATPTGVGAVLLGHGVPCEAWTATVAEMSERQLAALIDEAGSREQLVESGQPSRDVAAPRSDPHRPLPIVRAKQEGPPIVANASSDVTVTFGAGSLGLALGENPAWVASSSSGHDSCFSAVVDRLNPKPDGSPGPAERTGVIHVADMLSAIDGRSVATVPYSQVIGMIKVAPRPLTLSFRSPPGPAAPDSNANRRAPGLACSTEEGVPPSTVGSDVEPSRGDGSSPRAEDAPERPARLTAQQAPVLPASLSQDIVHTVTQTASWVAKHGSAFEQTIRRRNEGNPSFQFLFDEKSEAAAFYRACIAWESCARETHAPAVASASEEAALTSTDEISQAGKDLFQRINAAHADISDRIGQASADIESLQAPEVRTAGGDTGDKQVQAWAVLQELKLQEDVLQTLRAKAKTTGGELDAGSSAMMEMTFSRVVRLTEQLADLELGQDTSPVPADKDRRRRPKSAPPRNAGRMVSESEQHRTTPGYAQPRSGRPVNRSSRSRSRKRSGTPEMLRHPERRPSRNASRAAASERPRSKSTGHRRPATQRDSDRYSVEDRHTRSVSARGANRRRETARSNSRGGRRHSKSWIDATSDRLNDTLWAEYSQAPPFGASSDRFWPQVFPSGRHRSESFRRGGGGEETPGPGSYDEYQPMGNRAASMNWRVGNDDLYAFLKAAGAEDRLPAFWREQFFRVRDLVDPGLGVLIDEHDLVTELGVTSSAARRKLLRQATAVLRSTLAMRRDAKTGHNGSGARFGGHGSHLGHTSSGSRRGLDVPGPGAYSPRDSSFRVPKRTNALYFTSTSPDRPRTTPRRARSPSPPPASAKRTPSRSRSRASRRSRRRRSSSSSISSSSSTEGGGAATPNARRAHRLHRYDDY